EDGAAPIDDRYLPAAAGGDLLHQGQSEATPRPGRGGLCRVPLREDLLAIVHGDARTRVVNLDHDRAAFLTDRNLDPARAAIGRGGDGVQGVVDQVADDGDQVTRMTGIAIEPAVGGQQ